MFGLLAISSCCFHSSSYFFSLSLFSLLNYSSLLLFYKHSEHFQHQIDGVPDQKSPPFDKFCAPERKPGFWARRAISCKWKRGLNASLTRGTLLYRLVGMPAQREPVLQSNSNDLKRSSLTGSRWDRQIGFHKTNIEALVGQAVWELLNEDNACDHCVRLDGKFANCVKVAGMASCPNCHFDRKGKRGSFLKAEKPKKAPARAEEWA